MTEIYNALSQGLSANATTRPLLNPDIREIDKVLMLSAVKVSLSLLEFFLVSVGIFLQDKINLNYNTKLLIAIGFIMEFK